MYICRNQNNLSPAAMWVTTVILVAIVAFYDLACGKSSDPALIEEYCKNFTHGSPDLMQFYSPMYPREYPSEINCYRTITAGKK